LNTKANTDRIEEILKVSINQQNLDDIHTKIKEVVERIDKIEVDLQSEPTSEGEDAEEASDDDNYENDQFSLPEEDKEQTDEEKEQTEGGNEQTEVEHKVAKRPTPKSKFSFRVLEKDKSRRMDEINEKHDYGNSKVKRSQHVLKSHPKFGGSEASTYNEDIRDSIRHRINQKNAHSKLSIETPLTTKESSTSTLINKLLVRSSKNKSKKPTRSEIDAMMNIISEILIKVNNNRMRLDTLEGNVELKIETLIKSFKEEASTEIHSLEDEIRGDVAQIHKKLGEFERLNYRLNKKILDKPYQYADAIKEALDKENSELKAMMNKKYDLLLTRIVDMKRQAEDQSQVDSQGFSLVKLNEDEIKQEIKADFENSKLMMLQGELEALRENMNSEVFKLSQRIAGLEHTYEDFKENIEYQVYEFKSHTSQEVNNAIKEFQSADRELKRHQDLFRDILGKYCNVLEEKHKLESHKDGKSVKESFDSTPMNVKLRARIQSTSPKNHLAHKKMRSSDRYKLSKSVIDQTPLDKHIENITRDDVIQVDVTPGNRSVLPYIPSHKRFMKVKSTMSSPRANFSTLNSGTNYEINQTLQKIRNTNSKQYKLLKKF
jgi:hypothetical protein